MNNANAIKLGVLEMSVNIVQILSREIATKINNNEIEANDDLINAGFSQKNISTFIEFNKINKILDNNETNTDASKIELDDLFGEKDTAEANKILNSYGDNKTNQTLN